MDPIFLMKFCLIYDTHRNTSVPILTENSLQFISIPSLGAAVQSALMVKSLCQEHNTFFIISGFIVMH